MYTHVCRPDMYAHMTSLSMYRMQTQLPSFLRSVPRLAFVFPSLRVDPPGAPSDGQWLLCGNVWHLWPIDDQFIFFWLEIVQLELHTCFSKGAGSGWFKLVPVLNFSATHSFLGLRVHRSVWSVDFPQIWHLGYLSCSDSSWSKPFKFVACPISSDTEELDTVNFPLSWVEQWLQGPWRKGSRAMTRTRLSCKLSSSNDVPSLRILPRMALMRFVIFMK